MIRPLERPIRDLGRRWILATAKLDAQLNNGKVPRAEVLRRLHGRSNALQAMVFRLRLVAGPQVDALAPAITPAINWFMAVREPLKPGQVPDTRPSQQEINDRLKNITRNLSS